MNITQLLKDCWRQALVWGIPASEPYFVGVHKTTETAFWRWSQWPKPGKHNIFVGKNIEKMATKKPLDKVYVGSFLYHEICHSLWTDKDLKGITEWCSDHKVPFRLFNLFEDGRIEQKFREIYKRKFNWLLYEEEVNSKELNPSTALFKLIQYEGKRTRFPSTFEHGKKVRAYYKRIIACNDCHELKPVLLDWMKDFPETEDDMKQMPNSGSKGNDATKGMEQAAEASDAEIAEKREESETVFHSFEAPESEEIDVETGTVTVEEYTNEHDILNSDGEGLIAEGCDRYIPLLSTIFKERKGCLNTEIPTRRLNTKALATGSDKIYRKKKIIKPAAKNINYIIDCSASMGGTPIMNARAFALILSKLARMGKVTGHVILTVGYDYGCTQTLTLPLKESEVRQIPANGGYENIEGTVNLVKPLLKKADYNFFFTDGQINDDPLDKKKLRREGVYTYGLYVGNPSNAKLENWFDRSISRWSLEELINELIRKIK